MKCPVCKTPDLLMADRQGIEVDYCPTCRGVWLDRGELDKLIERAADESVSKRRRQRQVSRSRADMTKAVTTTITIAATVNGDDEYRYRVIRTKRRSRFSATCSTSADEVC